MSVLTDPTTIKVDSPTDRRVGLLAGWGRYPILVAEELRRQGCRIYCLGVKEHADPQLAALCDDFEFVGLAKLGRAIRYFKRHGVRDVTMAGKIHKFKLFQPWMWMKHFPDGRTARRFAHHFVYGTRDRKDDTLLLAVVEEFAIDGIQFAPATDFVPELLVKLGKLTQRAPSSAEREDIEFGWRVAKELGRFDVGQCVAIKGKAAIAVEAIEGTDQCIERAGALCRAGGFTLVKVAKPQQDMRFDVPTIGVGTLEAMVRAGATCLAVEAERTIILDQTSAIQYADRNGLSIVALDATSVAA
jgi:hypothetical protein